MTDFDDELRALFADDRLDVNQRRVSVEDVVVGARRRRARRVAAVATGSVAVAAAVVAMSFAAGDVLTAPGPPPAVEPVTPSPSPAPTTPEAPTTPPGTTPPPTTAPSADPPAVDPPEQAEQTEAEQTEADQTESADPEPDGSSPPADDTPDPDRFGSLPAIDPADGFGGVALGMTIDELNGVPGVTISEFTEGGGRTDHCYGRYESAEASGFISVRGTWGALPEDDEELYAEYRVTSIVPTIPARTPEGIAVGSTTAELFATYPEVDGEGRQLVAPIHGLGWAAFWRLEASDTVTDLWLDGMHNCVG